MKVLGIIPARGGSKRIPRKNIVDLGGKPLFQWTLDAAIESKLFANGMLWVSTEDEEIGQLAGKYWWKRDSLLARDNTPTLPVILELFNSHSADAVVLLQPTSPFRTADDIKNAFDIFTRCDALSVISVTDGAYESFTMSFAKRLNSVKNALIENGAIYILRKEVLDQGLSWYDGPRVYGYTMPKNVSIDIDDKTDLEIARFLINNEDRYLHSRYA